MASSPILIVQDLSVQHLSSGRTLVNQASFSLKKGGCLGVCGRSGSGQTLIISAMTDTLPQGLQKQSGSLKLSLPGHEARTLDTLNFNQLEHFWGQDLAVVPQRPASTFNPALTIGEHMTHLFKAHTDLSSQVIQRKLQELIYDTGLSSPKEYLAAHPFELTQDQLQRLAITIALALKPKLLLLDEPLEALDPLARVQTALLLEAFQKQHQSAILLASKDIRLLEHLCDEILFLDEGESIELQSKQEGEFRFKKPRSRSFFKAVPKLDYAHSSPSGEETRLPYFHSGSVSALVVREVEEEPSQPILWVRNLYKHAKPAPPWKIRSDTRSTLSNKFRLKGVSLSVYPGEQVVVVGSPDSGNSLLLQCLVGLQTVDGGEIYLNDKSLDQATNGLGRPSDLQFLFEDRYGSFDPDQKVIASLRRWVGLVYQTPSHSKKVATELQKLLKLVGLDIETLDYYPHQLGACHCQKALIARALASSPKLIVGVAPALGIDPLARIKLFELLNKLKQEKNLAILLTTGELQLALKVADRIIIMHRGRIVEAGTPADLVRHPEHDYTRLLLDATTEL